MRELRLDHVGIAVSDWESLNAFCRDVLGADLWSEPDLVHADYLPR